MSCLIFRLKNVTDDEKEEVRQLFADNEIEIYETDAGLFGTSVAGFWLRDSSQEDSAKTLLERYSQDRSERIRRAYKLACEQGTAETFWQRIVAQPVRSFLALLAVALILLVSIVPFIEFVV